MDEATSSVVGIADRDEGLIEPKVLLELDAMMLPVTKENVLSVDAKVVQRKFNLNLWRESQL